MKLFKGRDYSTMLIWAAGLVGMIRYSAAFLASDVGQIIGATSQVITVLLGVSGFAMGILGTFGTTYLFDGWRRKMPASGHLWPFKFKVLTCFVIAAFIAEMAILVPFTVSRMEHVTMSAILGGGVWWWSVAVNIMPMLLLGGVSVGNQVVVVGNFAESFANVPKEDAKVSANFRGDWRKVRPYLSDVEVTEIATLSTSEIRAKYHLNNNKTAQNWRKYAQVEVSARVQS